MPNSVYLDIYDPTHTTLLVPSASFSELEWVLSTQSFGILKATFDLSVYALLRDRVDDLIELWRSVDGGPFYLEGETMWLIKSVEQSQDASGHSACKITAFSLRWLATTRIVAFPANSPQAAKTGAADDMLKAIMKENAGPSAYDSVVGNFRGFRPVAIQTSLGLAPSVSNAFSYRVLSDVFKTICDAAYQAGTYLTWDIVVLSAFNLEFRTYVGARGSNRSSLNPNINQPVVLDVVQNNLSNLSYLEDWSTLSTYIYCGGQGQEADRIVTRSYLPTAQLYGRPFGLVEKFVDSRQSSTTPAVQSDGDAALRANRVVRAYSGNILDGGRYLYGRHYGFGDIVTAKIFGQLVDCRLDVVSGKWSGSQETITMKLQTDG